VSSNCFDGCDNHTTCNVNVRRALAIYAQQGSTLSQQRSSIKLPARSKARFRTLGSGSFTQDGVTYNVSTQVSVSVAGSQDAAMSSASADVIG